MRSRSEDAGTVAAESGWGEIVVDSAILKVSIVGAEYGWSARWLGCLRVAQHQVYSNDCHLRNKISAVVAQRQGVMALQASSLPLGLLV